MQKPLTHSLSIKSGYDLPPSQGTITHRVSLVRGESCHGSHCPWTHHKHRQRIGPLVTLEIPHSAAPLRGRGRDKSNQSYYTCISVQYMCLPPFPSKTWDGRLVSTYHTFCTWTPNILQVLVMWPVANQSPSINRSHSRCFNFVTISETWTQYWGPILAVWTERFFCLWWYVRCSIGHTYTMRFFSCAIASEISRRSHSCSPTTLLSFMLHTGVPHT